MDRAILHSDINACYASIELLYHPELRGKPFAVCGTQELRHGIVLSKDETAKRMGVKTGMAIWQAKQCCPELQTVTPNFDRYMKYSKLIRGIYSEYTDLVEPFGIDECWLDITNCLACPDPVKTAHEIRERVKKETGLTVSIGVSWNKILAKLGSDYKKPDAVTVISRDNFESLVWPLPASDMLMVGRSTSRTLERMGIRTIGELAHTDPRILKNSLGKCGLMLRSFANGLDSSPVARLGDTPPPQSIGNSSTFPQDIKNTDDAHFAIMTLAECVGTRLRRENYMCRSIELSLRDTELNWTSHRMRLRHPTDITRELTEYGMALFFESHSFPAPLRSMGLRALELVKNDCPEQVDIFLDYVNIERQKKLDAAVDRIRLKYGADSIQRASVFSDPAASGRNISILPDHGSSFIRNTSPKG